MNEKLRWKIWNALTKLPNICPANAHSVVIYGERRDPRVDAACRRDFARNGVCWCGKLRESWPDLVEEETQ